MDFAEYQRLSRRTAKYPAIGHPIVYPTLGLTNEAGEVAGKIKKLFRDRNGQLDETIREDLKAELGDVLWYLTQIATELGFSLEEIARYNIAKLADRQSRGVIRGDGDHR